MKKIIAALFVLGFSFSLTNVQANPNKKELSLVDFIRKKFDKPSQNLSGEEKGIVIVEVEADAFGNLNILQSNYSNQNLYKYVEKNLAGIQTEGKVNQGEKLYIRFNFSAK